MVESVGIGGWLLEEVPWRQDLNDKKKVALQRSGRGPSLGKGSEARRSLE